MEFKAGRTPGFGFSRIQDELSDIVGRRVDLKTPAQLSKYFRDEVLAGEAANRVTLEGRARYSEIPWQDIVDTRNRIVHGYDTVNYDVVWKILDEELPVLIGALERALPGHTS